MTTRAPAFSRAAWNRLLDRAAEQGEVTRVLLIADDRSARVCRIRFAVAWVGVHELGASAHALAQLLGGRHHTTILSALHRATGLRDTDPSFRALTDALTAAHRADVAASAKPIQKEPARG